MEAGQCPGEGAGQAAVWEDAPTGRILLLEPSRCLPLPPRLRTKQTRGGSQTSCRVSFGELAPR